MLTKHIAALSCPPLTPPFGLAIVVDEWLQEQDML
jgi:hypothetical protein